MAQTAQVFEVAAPTFTRPADTTQYAAGDLVANSTTAGSVVPLVFLLPARRVKLYGAKMTKSAAAVTTATFKLHLYKDSPTAANGDNAAWSTTSSNYLGNISLDLSTNTFTNTNTATSTTSTTAPLVFSADADNLVYGLLAAVGTYTPASAETFSVSLLGEASD